MPGLGRPTWAAQLPAAGGVMRRRRATFALLLALAAALGQASGQASAPTTTGQPTTGLPTPEPDAEPNSTESNVLVLPDSFNWFCQSQHADGFLFSTAVNSDGCQVECIFLYRSASRIYLDQSVRYVHNLQDGIYCNRSQVCLSGRCVSDEHLVDAHHRYGFAVVEILDAQLPIKDLFGATDAYVKVYIIEHRTDRNQTSSTKIGRTRTINNDNEPHFQETFKSARIAKAAYAMFKLFDKDQLDNDDYIATLYTPIQQPAGGDHVVKLLFGDRDEFFLNVRISWIDAV